MSPSAGEIPSQKDSSSGRLDICLTSEVLARLDNLQASDAKVIDLADDATYSLSRSRPALGCRLAGTITGPKIKNLRNCAPSASGTGEIQILLAFDPWRSAILLVAGDNAGKRNLGRAEAIQHAGRLYETYLTERAEEMARR